MRGGSHGGARAARPARGAGRAATRRGARKAPRAARASPRAGGAAPTTRRAACAAGGTCPKNVEQSDMACGELMCATMGRVKSRAEPHHPPKRESSRVESSRASRPEPTSRRVIPPEREPTCRERDRATVRCQLFTAALRVRHSAIIAPPSLTSRPSHCHALPPRYSPARRLQSILLATTHYHYLAP